MRQETNDDLARRDTSGLPERRSAAATDTNGSAHTPGPWEIAEEVYGDDRGVICVEHPVWDAIDVIIPRWANSDSRDEHLANARLIAAAPEMYAACLAARRWLSSTLLCLPTETDRECMTRVQRETRAALDAALAKVDGQ